MKTFSDLLKYLKIDGVGTVFHFKSKILKKNVLMQIWDLIIFLTHSQSFTTV